VNPGDLILADEDGVMVASPQVARDKLATCQELEEWEEYALGQLDKGRAFGEVMQERRTYNAS
jgi:regulator of RNase E activity RraA